MTGSPIKRPVLSPAAYEDVVVAARYVARDNPKAARALVVSLGAACQRLADRPGLGRVRSDIVVGVRSFATGSYAIDYFAADHGIDVVRVLHGKHDVAAEFAK